MSDCGYDPSDPKHPDWADRLADHWDFRDKTRGYPTPPSRDDRIAFFGFDPYGETPQNPPIAPVTRSEGLDGSQAAPTQNDAAGDETA